MTRQYRLAVLMSHAIANHGSLFRKLAEHPAIDLTVYYFCPDFGLTEGFDGEMGRSFKWDVPVLDGYRYEIVPNYSPVSGRGGFAAFINPGIVARLVAGRYDAVMIHGYRLASEWIGFVTAWLSRTPVMFRGDTGSRPGGVASRRLIKQILLRLLFRHTAACMAIGSQSRQFFRRYGVEDARTFLTPHSVDNGFFIRESAAAGPRRAEIRAQLGIDPDRPVILQTSKLIPRKGPLDLLKAFEQLDRPATLLFVGDGELRPSLEAYVRDHAVRNVVFAGFRLHSELPSLYAISDLFVLPSTFDIFGLVINEAMCAGLPIITTDAVGAVSDLVDHGSNGLVYPVGDIKSLSDALQQLLDDPALRSRMGDRSLEIIKRWSHAACVSAVVAALDRMHPGLRRLDGAS